jgi:hypothetical protein
MEDTMKTCQRCKKELEDEKFGKLKRACDGLRAECKECRNASLRTGKPNTGRFQKGRKDPLHGERMKKWFAENGHPNKGKKGLIPWNKGRFESIKRWGSKHIIWSKAVRERDSHKCQKCSTTEGKIIAHHIIPWRTEPDKRFDVENGITLCQSCHGKEEGFQKGHEVTEYNKQRTKEVNVGRASWNKGKKMSDEHRKKLSESHKGQVAWNKGTKGVCKAWNKGLKNKL